MHENDDINLLTHTDENTNVARSQTMPLVYAQFLIGVTKSTQHAAYDVLSHSTRF